jgi:hypothetical protein
MPDWTVKPASQLYDLGTPVDVLIDHDTRTVFYRADFASEPMIRALFGLAFELATTGDAASVGDDAAEPDLAA